MKKIPMMSATEMATAIREGRHSSVELVTACLEEIEKHNGRLNAIVTLAAEEALQRAKEADDAIEFGINWGPLHGVPFTVKDVFETKGVRTTAGNEELKEYIPEEDAEVVRRLREAGGILLGKSNTPAMAMDVQTENTLFGSTKNPWDQSYTPGGSSGGEGAAVAAGFSPLGVGSDIGGSVRIPAHYCGLFALKPTEGAIPTTGHIPPLPGKMNPFRHMVHCGALARSVADLRLFLSATAGSGEGDGATLRSPFKSRRVKPLAMGRFLWCDHFADLPVTDETKSALRRVANELRALGCQVDILSEEAFDFSRSWSLYGELAGHMLNGALSFPSRALMKCIGPIIGKDCMSRGTFRSLLSGTGKYLAALEERDRLREDFEKLLEGYDGLLCPASVGPAFKHRKMGNIHHPITVDGEKVAGNLASTGYTAPFNLTGHPALCLPLCRSRNGLPIGMQLVGRLWSDYSLLAMGEALEKELCWFRVPCGIGGEEK